MGRKERPWSSISKRKGGYFLFSLLFPYYFSISLLLPIPAKTLGRHIQFRPESCFWSEGYRSALEFSLPCTYTNTSAQHPSAVCPHGLTALPIGKSKPGSCQFQLCLRPCSPIKEALLVKGCPLFPKHGKKGVGGSAQIGAGNFHWLEFSRSYEWV